MRTYSENMGGALKVYASISHLFYFKVWEENVVLEIVQTLWVTKTSLQPFNFCMKWWSSGMLVRLLHGGLACVRVSRLQQEGCQCSSTRCSLFLFLLDHLFQNLLSYECLFHLTADSSFYDQDSSLAQHTVSHVFWVKKLSSFWSCRLLPLRILLHLCPFLKKNWLVRKVIIIQVTLKTCISFSVVSQLSLPKLYLTRLDFRPIRHQEF